METEVSRVDFCFTVNAFYLFTFSTRDHQAPSADCCEILSHYRNFIRYCNAVAKTFVGLPGKKWWPKTCKI